MNDYALPCSSKICFHKILHLSLLTFSFKPALPFHLSVIFHVLTLQNPDSSWSSEIPTEISSIGSKTNLINLSDTFPIVSLDQIKHFLNLLSLYFVSTELRILRASSVVPKLNPLLC